MAQRVLTAGWQTVTYETAQVVWVVKNKVRASKIGNLPSGDRAGANFLGPEVIPPSTVHFQGPGVIEEYPYTTGFLEEK